MEEFIGHKCRVLINIGKKLLCYEATINTISANHITFTDRYGRDFMFALPYVAELHRLDQERNNATTTKER